MPPNWGDKYSVLLIAGDEASHVICKETFRFFHDIVFMQEDNPIDGRITAGMSHPDLVITDVEFPNQNRKTSEGYYRAMKLICPLTKFMIYSYVQDEEIIGKYIGPLGAECYFFKPIVIDQLVKKTLDLVEKPYPDWMKEKFP